MVSTYNLFYVCVNYQLYVISSLNVYYTKNVLFNYFAFLAEVPSTEEMDVDKLLESLETKKNGSICIPTCISSVILMKLPIFIVCCNVTEMKPCSYIFEFIKLIVAYLYFWYTYYILLFTSSR